MRPILLVSVLLLGSALPGCSDDGAGSGSTAQDGLSAANAAARGWHEDAALVGVNGAEFVGLAEELRGDDAPPEFSAIVPRDDRSIGDGRAPAWMYVYQHEGHYFLAVVSEGRVTFANETFDDDAIEAFHDNLAMPLGEFEVDSDEAADIASEDANFSAAARSEGAGAVYALAFDANEGGPVWTLIVAAEDGSQAIALVSATTGERLPVPDTFPGVEELLREAGQVDATSTAVQDGTGEFSLAFDGHATLGFQATAPTMAPLSSLSLTITDPDGAVYQLEVSNGGGATPATVSNVLEVPMPAPGVWTVSVELSQGVRQAWTLEWCTDGMDTPQATPNGACAA